MPLQHSTSDEAFSANVAELIGRRGRSTFRCCEECGKSRLIPPYRAATFRFCSRKCAWAWRAKNDRVLLRCAVCSRDFGVIKCREKTARYCSPSCYYRAMARVGTVDLTCDACGVGIKKAPSRVRPRNYCSSTCRLRAPRVISYKTAASARHRMLSTGTIRACSRCGYDEHPEILVVHHADRNRANNSPTNLEILCPNCHALEHYSVPHEKAG